ncbi:MAG: hypothetical protein ACRCTY_10720 [Candidatus Adiutrix sp.]
MITFTIVSVMVMHLYFDLYFDNKTLKVEHHQVSAELYRLKQEKAFQEALELDRAKLLGLAPTTVEAEGDPTPLNVPAETVEDDTQTQPELNGENPAEPEETTPQGSAPNLLDGWAALFPDPSLPPEQNLALSRLNVNGGRYSFTLISEHPSGAQAQGHLLMVFAVMFGEEVRLIPAFNFDVTSPDANFSRGSA